MKISRRNLQRLVERYLLNETLMQDPRKQDLPFTLGQITVTVPDLESSTGESTEEYPYIFNLVGGYYIDLASNSLRKVDEKGNIDMETSYKAKSFKLVRELESESQNLCNTAADSVDPILKEISDIAMYDPEKITDLEGKFFTSYYQPLNDIIIKYKKYFVIEAGETYGAHIEKNKITVYNQESRSGTFGHVPNIISVSDNLEETLDFLRLLKDLIEMEKPSLDYHYPKNYGQTQSILAIMPAITKEIYDTVAATNANSDNLTLDILVSPIKNFNAHYGLNLAEDNNQNVITIEYDKESNGWFEFKVDGESYPYSGVGGILSAFTSESAAKEFHDKAAKAENDRLGDLYTAEELESDRADPDVEVADDGNSQKTDPAVGSDIKFKPLKGQNPQIFKKWDGNAKAYVDMSQDDVNALDNYQFKVYSSDDSSVVVQRYYRGNPLNAYFKIPTYVIDDSSGTAPEQIQPPTNAELAYYNVKGKTGKADGKGGMEDVKEYTGINVSDGNLQYVDDEGNVLKTVQSNTTLSAWLNTIPVEYKYDTYYDFEQAVRDKQGDPNDPIEDTPESAKAAIKAIAQADDSKKGVVKVPRPDGVGTDGEELVVNIDPDKPEVVEPYIVPKVADDDGNKEPVKVDDDNMIKVTVVATKQALLDDTAEVVDEEVKTAVTTQTTQTTQTSEGDPTSPPAQTKPTKKEADSWARYISETVRLKYATQEEAEAIRDGWKSLSSSNPDLSTGEYRNWQRWYNKIRNDRAFMDMYVGKPAGSHISPQDIARVYGMFAISEPETYGGTEIASQVTVDDVQAGLTNISKREKRKEARREKGRKFLQNVKDLNPQLLKDFIDKRKAKKAESTDQATSTGASSTASSSQTRTLQSLKDEAQQWIDSQTTGRTYVTVTAQQPNTARLKAANKLRTGEADVFLDHVVGPDSNGAYAYIAYSKDAEAGTNESNQLNERMMRLAGIGRQTKSQAQQEKHLQEAVSRGELYRRRYYGRY